MKLSKTFPLINFKLLIPVFSFFIFHFSFFINVSPAYAQTEPLWVPAEDINCGGGCPNLTYCVQNTQTNEYSCQAYVPSTAPVDASQYRVGLWQMPTVKEFQTDAYSTDSLTGSGYISFIGTGIVHTVSTLGVGPDPSVIAANPNAVPRAGAIGAFSGLIAGMTSTPPIHTANYIADIGQNLGLAKPAYAQGTGMKALEPVLPLWKAFRNIAYFGFVIIFVVVGFMIMFRAKINPQTVISIQAALPQIIITLLLITFSYAIASLMIDLIYVFIYLLVGVMGTFGIIAQPKALIDDFMGQNAFEFFGRLVGANSPASGAAHAVGEVVDTILGKNLITGLSKFISEPLAYVIFVIAILIAVFKLFFQLLMAYIGIIFATIFAPISLLFNAFPGSQSFSKWLKGIFANAIIFPVVAMLFVIAAALTGSRSFYVADTMGFQGSSTTLALPFVGGGFDTGALQALIGIGCIMIMPKIVEIVQKMMGIEGGFAGMAGAAMEPIAGAWGGFRALGKGAINTAAIQASRTRGDDDLWGQIARIYAITQGYDVPDTVKSKP